MPQQIISQFNRNYGSPIETNRQVSTVAIRDAIPAAARWPGMLVYVITDAVTYILTGGVDNTDWELFNGVPEAPIDGEYYVRKDGNWELMPSALVPSYGTFSPVLTDAGGGATYTVGTVSAQYSKVGRVVFFTITLGSINTSGAPSGALEIHGFPFNLATGGANTSFSISWFRLSNASDSNLNKIGAYMAQDDNKLKFTNKTAALTSITFTNPGAIQVSGTYLTN